MFLDEALEMGLTQIDNGLYEYQDRYSSIWYEQLMGISRQNSIPSLGIFTARPNANIDDAEYIGAVSMQYKFVGNSIIVDTIKNSIRNIDNNVNLIENVVMNSTLTQLNSEVLIINTNSNKIEIGSVIPMISIDNSYNGTKAANYSFGIAIINSNYESIGSFSFKKKIMGMRQIHIVTSNTTLESNIGSYINIFNDNITDLIQQNFQKEIPPEDAMKALNMVESLGKKRFSGVVNNLAQITRTAIHTNENDELEIPSINAWNMFLAIATYSVTEENLNAKKMLENIAERTLVIPTKMLEALKRN